MSELTSFQQAIRERFLSNYQAGGIEACRAMVNDLAAEVALAVATSEGAQEVRHETISEQDSLTTEEIVARLRMLDDIPRAAAEALSRHSFALFLLRVVEKATGAA